MTARVTAHTVARFVEPSGGSPLLLIEPDPGAYLGIDVHLLISPPAVAESIVADVGQVRLKSIKEIDVTQGILEVSGSNTCSLPRLPATRPLLNVLFAFDAATGAVIHPTVRLNILTGLITLSKNCYAAVSYGSYKTRVQELLYTPLVEGFSVTYGVIAAFRKPATMVIYQVELPTFNGQNDLEIYRITSPAITTPTGEFEKPPGFPTDGSYPGKTFVLNLDVYLQTKRVHEIGRMRPDGFAYVTRFYVPVLDPYIGDLAYSITKTLEESTLPNDLPSNLVLKAKDYIASRQLGVI